tara:strand:- start:1520 stop:1762 length:243 start_codon:yes stop_codon:yes gene_type:complete
MSNSDNTTDTNSSDTTEESTEQPETFNDWMEDRLQELEVPENLADVSKTLQYIKTGRKDRQSLRIANLIAAMLKEVKHDK